MRRASPQGRWPTAVIVLHALSALLIVGLIAIGWWMRHADVEAATAFDLYQWHKSVGFLALAVTVTRLCARLVFRPSPAALGAAWERALAAIVQALLYALTLAAILAGWLLVSASPLPIPTRLFDLVVVPNLSGPNPELFARATLAHAIIGYAIAALIALHVAGALKHQFIDRDAILRRMLPRWRWNARGP